jgi:hypothetical protein
MAPATYAEGSDDITAVSAKVSSDYVRSRKADGSFQTELYAFGVGGHYGGPMHDESIDSLKFLDVARVIADPLAEQAYLPGKDPKKTKLLIMVYWGLTAVPPQGQASPALSFLQIALDNLKIQEETGGNIPGALSEVTAAYKQTQMENDQRDRTNFGNAKMLGYDRDGLIGTDYGNFVAHSPLAAGQRRNDMVSEIEDSRYFVVLMAYDFQMLWVQKKHKLLWETRFSVRQRHNQFDKDLPAMAQYASKYFGQDSGGLIRGAVPFGHVEIGDVKSLGSVPDK